MGGVSWIEHALGLDGGPIYNFYSGFGQAVGSITLLGGLFTYLNQRKCSVEGCRQRGKVKLPGTDWTVCAGHHPDGPLTQAKIDEMKQQRG